MPMQRNLAPTLAALALVALPFPVRAVPVELRVDLERSHIFAITHGSSLFGAQGAEHAIVPTHWTLSLCMDAEHPAAPGASAELDIPVSGLELDTEMARRLAGLSGTPAPADVARLRARMLGPGVLDAEHYPAAHFSARTIAHPSAAYPVIRGDVTLRGVSVPVAAAMDITPAAEKRVHIVSHFPLTQSNFGIALETIKGMTEIADQFDVMIDLWATSTGKACAAPAPPSPPKAPSQNR